MHISNLSIVDSTVNNKTTYANKAGNSNTEQQVSEPVVVATDVNSPLEVNDETTAKIKEAVSKMNDMLDVNNSTSKFIYHEGLHRYYVTVVDKETEEVVKEIPPRKLLDAFYEMQKMLGMVVDEKI